MNRDYDTNNNGFLVTRLTHRAPVEFCKRYGLNVDAYSQETITDVSGIIPSCYDACEQATKIASIVFNKNYAHEDKGVFSLAINDGVPNIGVWEVANDELHWVEIEAFHVVCLKSERSGDS